MSLIKKTNTISTRDRIGITAVFIIIAFIFFMFFIIQERGKAEYFNRVSIENFIAKKESLSSNEFEVIILNEIKKCLQSNSPKFHSRFEFVVLDINEIEKNYGSIYNSCINLRMRHTLQNDASRFEFLSRLLKENNIDYDLKKANFILPTKDY